MFQCFMSFYCAHFCSHIRSHHHPPPPSDPLDPRDSKECIPPKSPRRPPFGGRGMPGISPLRLFSQCRQAAAFLVNWSWPHTRSPRSPPHLSSPTSTQSYCQSTLNTLSTADLNHVEEMLVPIEPIILYNSKTGAFPRLWEGVALDI